MKVLNDMFSPYYLEFLAIIWAMIFIYQVIAKHSWVNILIVTLVISFIITVVGIIEFDIIDIITNFISDFISSIVEKVLGSIIDPISSFFQDLFAFDWWPF